MIVAALQRPGTITKPNKKTMPNTPEQLAAQTGSGTHILYNGTNPFNQICHTPLVEYQANTDGHIKRTGGCTLKGQILCCGLTTSEILEKQNALKYSFLSKNFQSFQIFSKGKLALQFSRAYIKSINFDESDFNYVLPFSITVEEMFGTVRTYGYKIEDASYSITDNFNTEDGCETKTTVMSAKGGMGGCTAAIKFVLALLENASCSDSLVNIQRCYGGLVNIDCNLPTPNPTFDIVCGSQTVTIDELKENFDEVNETIDYANSTYELTLVSKACPDDTIVTADGENFKVKRTHSVSTSVSDDGSISVTVSASCSSDNAEATGAGLNGFNFLSQAEVAIALVAQSIPQDCGECEPCTMVIDPNPTSKSDSQNNSSGLSVSRSLTFKTMPCNGQEGQVPCLDITSSWSFSASNLDSRSDSGATYSASSTLSANGTCGTKAERRNAANEYISNTPCISVPYPGGNNMQLVGEGISVSENSVSKTCEWASSSEVESDTPCGLNDFRFNITENDPLDTWTFKRGMCSDWLAIKNGFKPGTSSYSASAKYVSEPGGALGFIESFYGGEGIETSNSSSIDSLSKTVEVEKSWEESQDGASA